MTRNNGFNCIGCGLVRCACAGHLGPLVTPDEPDMVIRPAHYNSHPKGIECIDVIEDNPYPNLANVMRYVWRVSWGGKHDDIEDLRKAARLLNREINRRTGQGGWD